MPAKYIPPSVNAGAFNCPHCGVLTSQFWHQLGVKPLSREAPIPQIWDAKMVGEYLAQIDGQADGRLESRLLRLAGGMPFLDGSGPTTSRDVYNMWLSKCMECQDLAVWIYDRLVWPAMVTVPEPNLDMAPDIIADYREAAEIYGISPRGAAALLRLCIQKLCAQVGESGQNLNTDIGSLVAKGLDGRIAKALDIVRVIGNEAVHPGQMDLKDNSEIASELFRLVNMIADTMITKPKEIERLYQSLPEAKRAAIEQRDAQALLGPPRLKQ